MIKVLFLCAVMCQFIPQAKAWDDIIDLSGVAEGFVSSFFETGNWSFNIFGIFDGIFDDLFDLTGYSSYDYEYVYDKKTEKKVMVKKPVYRSSGFFSYLIMICFAICCCWPCIKCELERRRKRQERI